MKVTLKKFKDRKILHIFLGMLFGCFILIPFTSSKYHVKDDIDKISIQNHDGEEINITDKNIIDEFIKKINREWYFTYPFSTGFFKYYTDPYIIKFYSKDDLLNTIFYYDKEKKIGNKVYIPFNINNYKIFEDFIKNCEKINK